MSSNIINTRSRSGARGRSKIVAEIEKLGLSPLEQAKLDLHTSKIPDVLLGREPECKTIKTFIIDTIKTKGGTSQAMYISGVPGTGKTASVIKVVGELKKTPLRRKFKFICVNGLELSEPKKLYCKIFKEAINEHVKKISPSLAQQRLNERFLSASTSYSKELSIVLLIDEIDMLCTKRQEVLYTIFNWSACPDSRCCIIAISNTLDLPERVLSQRVASRLGTTRLCFQPYEYTEIEAIVRHRISNCPAIASGAVEFASRKVASLSGDLRKAMELLRRAIDIALEECETNKTDISKSQLGVDHVTAAVRESMTSIRMEFCLGMSVHEELLFRALVRDLHSSGLEETPFSNILFIYRQLCSGQGIIPLSSSPAFRIVMQMACSHFVILSPDAGEMSRRIRLGFPLSEAQFCLRQMDQLTKKEQQINQLI